MTKKSSTLQRIGYILFSLGIFFELLILLVSTWPDLESVAYGFTRYTNETLPSLSCPVLMTELDRELVTLRLNNPLDKAINRTVRVQLSGKYNIISIDEKVKLQPGETKTLSWEIGKENTDVNYLIFVHAFAFPASSLEMKEATCGTYMMNLPIKGGPIIYYTTLGLAFFCLGVGSWLWWRNSDMSSIPLVSLSRRMRFITWVINIGMIASIFGWWIIGLMALVITSLTFVVFVVNRD